MQTPQELLKLDNICKSYGSTQVLKNINLSVYDNEFLTILGPSGSGKTTILKILAGFEDATQGAVLLNGQDISDMPINRRPFNTVFQDYALFPHMSVRKNVGYGLMVRGVDRAQREKRVDEAIETVGLTGYDKRLPSELSGGQRQRVALARAIICQPRVILLDEPLAALDVALRGQMCKFLKGMQRRLDIAFVFITHDQQEAIAMSDRIVVMRDGEIEQIGTPEGLYAEPQTRFVAEFFGENNLFDGVVQSGDGTWAEVETEMGFLTCKATHLPTVVGARVAVAVRPENVDLTEDASLGYACKVDDIQYSGATYIVEMSLLKASQLKLKCRLHGSRLPPSLGVGDTVGVTWAPGSAVVIGKRDA